MKLTCLLPFQALTESGPLLNFAKEMLLHPREVGAVCPSSPRLAQVMADCIPDGEGLVAELGAGTGVLTSSPVFRRRRMSNSEAFFLGRTSGQNTGRQQAAERTFRSPSHWRRYHARSRHAPLPQAISAAEQQVGGTAAKAAYKHKKGQYKVEVVKDTEVYDVIVDANDGTVLSVKKDSED